MEIIKVIELTKIYNNKIKALDNITLSIKSGELYGLLGVNGAGKTTLIKILSGLTKKTSGDAYVDSYNLNNITEIKKIIDISPQETAICPNLTVLENLKFFSNIYEINDTDYLNSIIEAFALNEVLKQKAKTLSGGWQRRLSIAIALISKPKVLFLDEPTLGLDVISRRELWKIIKSLRGKMTIILTSHYLEEIEALCDRVAIMKNGKKLEEGTIKQLKNEYGEESFEEVFIKIVGGNK